MKITTQKYSAKLILALALVLLVALSITKPALAFEDIPDGYIPKDETIIDDVFISAETVIIDGTVYGDVIAAAEKVIVNGTIEGNLILNSGTTEINGFINGSVGFAGQKLTINSVINGSVYFAGVELLLTPEAQINRNILFTGFSLQTQPDSIIGTDLHGTGYQVALDGIVGRNVFVDVAAAEVSGKIQGDATFHVGEPNTNSNLYWMQIWANYWGVTSTVEQMEMGLRVHPEAEILGVLKYKSGVEQSDAILAEPGGGIEFEQTSTKPKDGRTAAQLWLVARVRELLALLALGGLAAWLLPKPLLTSSGKLRAKPGKSLGWGILSLIGGYSATLVTLTLIIILGTLLAIVTLGGLAKAIFAIGLSGLVMIFSIFTVLVVYGSKVVVAYYLGDLILSRVRGESTHLRVMAFLVGLAIYMMLRLIPVLSIIVGILATLLGLGAMFLAFKSRKKAKLLAESQETPAGNNEGPALPA